LLVPLRLRRYHAAMPIAARYHGAVERFAGKSLPREPLVYVAGESAIAAARAKLIEQGVDPTKPLVVMSPGALWPTKQWPVQRFGSLAAKASVRGVTVVLTGSAAETPLTRQVRDIAPLAVDLAGKLSLAELGGVLSHARAVVANDSGPMHMARALAIPTLAFFGSTDPAQFRFDGHALAYAAQPCSPCSLHGLVRCPRQHFRCMGDLDVDGAYALLERLLDGPARAPVTD
jgi:ADP-heptose:LPS heptosyltransferase